MREFVVSKAALERVAGLTRETVEAAGGVVALHTDRVTEFDNLHRDEGDWSRSGYVGTYKRYREEPVHLRIRVWASWPRKLFLWSVWLGLIEAVILLSLSLIGLSPPPNVWILTAILTFALLGVTLLLYASSWADSADLEDKIARKLTGAIQSDQAIPGDVYTIGEWEEHRQDVIEAAVEEAKRDAPERASRTRRALQTIKAGQGEGGTQLLQRFRSSDEPGDDEPDAGETSENDEDDEATPLVQRLAFWRGADEPEDEPPEGEPREDEELSQKEQRLQELKRRREEMAGRADEEGEPGTGNGDEELSAKQQRLEELKRRREQMAREQGEEATDDVDEDAGPGVVDRLAFWRRSDEPSQDAPPADEGDRESGQAGPDAPEAAPGDDEAEEIDAPDASDNDRDADDGDADDAQRDPA